MRLVQRNEQPDSGDQLKVMSLPAPLDNSTLASMIQYARKETCSQSCVSIRTSDIVVSRREECSQEDLRNVNLVKVSCPNRS
jgi:hypothetical protein